MATLVHLDASPRPDGASRVLSAAFVDAWRDHNPDGVVIRQDLTALAIPHLGPEHLDVWFLDPAARTEEQRAVLALSDRLIDELLAADVIVLGVPMWNFGIPSSLKAWIDHVIRAGRTVDFTPAGPVGLLPDPKVVVITARGGEYGPGSPLASLDFQEPYLRTVLGLIGAVNITFVHAERQGPSYDDGSDAVLAARAQLLGLAAGDDDGVTIDLTALDAADQRA